MKILGADKVAPGWYWCRIDYSEEWVPHHTSYDCTDAEYLTIGPPCLGNPVTSSSVNDEIFENTLYAIKLLAINTFSDEELQNIAVRVTDTFEGLSIPQTASILATLLIGTLEQAHRIGVD